jgi:hypothetical protein
MGLTQNIATIVKERVGEIIAAKAGYFTVDEVADDLLEAGDVTWEQIGRAYGRNGLKVQVINPIIKEEQEGRPTHVYSGNQKWVQLDFASFEDHTYQYHHKRRHAEASLTKVEKYRQIVIELFHQDPAEEPDPVPGLDED